MPVLMNPEIIGASFPVNASDQPYQAKYLGRSCVNHCEISIRDGDWRMEFICWGRCYNVSDGDLAERLHRRAKQAEKDTADLVGPSRRTQWSRGHDYDIGNER